MTLSELTPFIDHPVFGDERCLEAIRLLQLIDRLKAARDWGCYSQWVDYYEYKDPKEMSREDIEGELFTWFAIGYEEEETA